MKKWMEVCIKHLASEDPAVQRSVGMALRGMGPAARPALEAAAQGDDPRIAAAAKRVLDAMARGREARGNQRGGNRRGDFMQRMAEQLELTDDQKPKVNAILQDAMTKQRELFQQMRDGSLPREEARGKMQEIREATMSKLSEVLTEEQLARYREMGQRGGRRRGGGGGGIR
jgi:Spy/CpxP family protein refolding chaperone